MKKVLFLTGTRADFGKIKQLIAKLSLSKDEFDLHIFVTGMHMLSKYGSTYQEVLKLGLGQIYTFINQNTNDPMDIILAKTIYGLSDYIHENNVDMIIVHGDRVEALAGAIVGSLNNVLVAHIEGGEVSGAVDELIRHSVTKLSHIHYVSNMEAFDRLIQLGEDKKSIFLIGSPDVDIMDSKSLPSIWDSKIRYEIDYHQYAILAFHPVTTSLNNLQESVNIILEAVINSKLNYIVIYPNNDKGSDIILSQFENLAGHPRFKLFPSIRFEHYLTLLKNAQLIIGNSSAGIREAPHYGVPVVNVGNRQHRRSNSKMIINVDFNVDHITNAITSALVMKRVRESKFGDGNSAHRFILSLLDQRTWNLPKQKFFIDFDKMK